MPHDPFLSLLAHASGVLETEFGSLPKFEPQPGADAEAMAQVLEETAHRLGDNYPYFHPLYAGQMLDVYKRQMMICCAASPSNAPEKRPCAASAAVWREAQMMTPLPANSPSALTTMGG